MTAHTDPAGDPSMRQPTLNFSWLRAKRPGRDLIERGSKPSPVKGRLHENGAVRLSPDGALTSTLPYTDGQGRGSGQCRRPLNFDMEKAQ